MELKVLGPLEITDGRRAVDIGGARLRRLCCALLIAEGDAVSLDVLGERTWDDAERPGDVVRALRTYVSRLRASIPHRHVGHRSRRRVALPLLVAVALVAVAIANAIAVLPPPGGLCRRGDAAG